MPCTVPAPVSVPSTSIGPPPDTVETRGRSAAGRGRKHLRRLAAAAVFSALLCACGGPASAPTTAPTDAAPSPTPFLPSPSASATRLPTATPSLTATLTPEPPAERIPIVEYHHTTYRFSDEVMMTTDWFREQLQWLADNGYRTLTAEQLSAFLDGADVPVRSVVLTFDVGTAQRADFSANIIPALREHGFHALFFVVTDAISDACGPDNKICWPDLRDWAGEGLISVESHTVSHPDFNKIPAEEQRWEAQTSRQIIEQKTGRAPIGLAYPYDSYNESAPRVVESAGYQFALAGNTRHDRSARRSDPERFNLPRVYPYSNPNLYPVLYGAEGKTFGEMIADAGAGAAVTPTANPTATASATPSVADAAAYFAACTNVDKIADSAQRLYALDRLSFPLDIGADAQDRLAAPIILKPSCNVARGNVPRGIVLHTTRGTLQATLSEFQRPQNTSAHYVIDRDGQIYQLVPEGLGAFHASCGGIRSVCLPSCPLCEGPDGAFLEPYLQSVGIELVNDGQLPHPETYTGLIYEDYLMAFGYRYWEDFPEAQLRSLIILVNDIRARWGIPLDLVVGHYRINYKTDPGPALNISWYRVGNPPRGPIFSE
jgi:peptidoglycan/xylan/chitin deacetylase (PgdA/CDA1 family)